MIHVSIDGNEAMRPRAAAIRKAITSDPHFKEIPPVESRNARGTRSKSRRSRGSRWKSVPDI